MTECSPIRLPLSLEPGDDADARPAAWLIPGGDAGLWLRELCGWGIPLDEVQLLIVPAAAGDVRAVGVLAITSQTPTPSPLALPYVRLAERLFLPAGAHLRPRMSEAELREWLVWDVQLLHPTIGLIGCRREELLTVADLLDAPPPDAVDWSLADPGVAAEARVRSVKPAALPEIGQFLRESSDGIGDENPSELPPLPSESPLSKAASAAALGGLAAMQWIASHMPGGAGTGAGGGTGWIERLGNWITVKQQQWRAGLEEARNKELARLLRLLQSNPDDGLRYALPLNAQDSRRGLAPPGARLGPRNTNFNFGSLFSAAPGDPWQIEHEMRQKLMAKYRELASRELALGRFRRAAYVFAHLLGDLHSAANALQQGKFFREAATLYRDQLRNPQAAAQCLESGGLLEEAAEAYLALQFFKKAGDLYRQLQREEDAVRAYRRAGEEHQSRRDILAAAKLLHEKLDAREEAIELLWRQWPAGSQATQCLREYFALMGRSARHDDVARRVTALAQAPWHSAHVRGLAEVLADLTGSYPSHPVRALAGDAVRVVVGRRLSDTAEPDAFSLLEARELVNAVTRTTLDDRLLRRDGVRFVDALSTRQPKPKPAPPARKPARPAPGARKIVLVHAFALGMEAEWFTAIARGSTLYAQGVRRDGVVIARATWAHATQHVVLPRAFNQDVTYRLEVGPMERNSRQLLLIPVQTHWLHPSAVGSATMASGGGFYDNLHVAIPSVLPPRFLFDACVDESDRLWLLHESPGVDNLVLSSFARATTLESSREFPVPLDDPPASPTVKLACVGGLTCVTSKTQMHVHGHTYRPGAVTAITLELGRAVVSVAASFPHTRPRVAVAFAEGACVVWPAEGDVAPFASDMLDPVIGLTRDGLLIAAGRQRVAVYQMMDREVQLLATAGPRAQLPVAITSAPTEGSFAVLYSDGLVQVMKCTAA